MYTVCTREEWLDDYFDLDWCCGEHGTFPTRRQAEEAASKLEDGMIVAIGD